MTPTAAPRTATLDLFARADAPVVQPTPDVGWASGAVFNPGAALDADGTLRLLARGIPSGYRRVEVDHADAFEPDFGYDDYVSALGLAVRQPGGALRLADAPLIAPHDAADRYGCEDARITRLGDRWWITYTGLAEPAATADRGVGICLASTTDWATVERYGRVGPSVARQGRRTLPRPRRREGRHVPPDRARRPGRVFRRPGADDGARRPVLGARPGRPGRVGRDAARTAVGGQKGRHRADAHRDARRLAASIYHGADDDHVYRAGLALLDRDDPCRVIARARAAILEPDRYWERQGDVPNVVFPQGATVDGRRRCTPDYGAADTPSATPTRRWRTWSHVAPRGEQVALADAAGHLYFAGRRTARTRALAPRWSPSSDCMAACPSSSPYPDTTGRTAWFSTRPPYLVEPTRTNRPYGRARLGGDQRERLAGGAVRDALPRAGHRLRPRDATRTQRVVARTGGVHAATWSSVYRHPPRHRARRAVPRHGRRGRALHPDQGHVLPPLHRVRARQHGRRRRAAGAGTAGPSALPRHDSATLLGGRCTVRSWAN